jgi:Transglycosylase
MNNKVLELVCRMLLAMLALLSLLIVGMGWWWWRHSQDEWTVPVRFGRVEVKVSAPATLRLLTQPTVARLLDGTRLTLPVGTITTQWDKAAKTQHFVCAPCRVPARGFGSEYISLATLDVSIQRERSYLHGRITTGGVTGTWYGTLKPNGLEFAADVPRTHIIELYELFRADIPELARAKIQGHFDAHIERHFPQAGWQMQTHVDLASVTGLATESLRGMQPLPSCAKSAAQVPGPRSKIALAVIAAEDQRFWTHHGYDPKELAAALTINAREDEAIRGASTLTQQVAKLMFVGAQRSGVRKLRELLYAVEMEQTLGKAQILNLYLAVAPWGDSVCGAEAAAQHYLAKPAIKLNVQEAAWLSALLRNPTMSIRNAESTREHAHWVVDGMAHISSTQRREAGRALDAATF